MIGFKYLLLLLISLPVFAFGQLYDDFGDGNFSNNPPWEGTTNKFIVNSSLQLQLNDTEAAEAWLSTPYSIAGDTEWRFWIRLAFSPSSNNFSQVFLVSDQSNLSVTENGYYLRFGEAGSADAIELFKIQNGISSSICRGTDGLIANSFSILIKVVRKTDGSWKIFADPTGTGFYQLEATGTDNTFSPGGFFGFHCIYTVSNATKMYFDNIVVENEVTDTTPPELLNITATDPFTLLLSFNEALSNVTALNVFNYQVNSGIGYPVSAVFGANISQVVLSFDNMFDSGTNYELTVSLIEDLEGNIMDTKTFLFSYYEAQTNDIVINEIMADPTPVVGIPEWEYVELFNTTDKRIDLNEWVFYTGTTAKPMSNTWIEAGGFLLLANENAKSDFQNYGPFFGFSSFQLTNSGQELKLVGKHGLLVSLVIFSDCWYGNDEKFNGGWSLEQINPLNPCGGKTNWIASINPAGGTPGAVNSVFSTISQPPSPERIRIVSENILQLWFDQFMDAVSVSNPAAYLVVPGNLVPTELYINPADPKFVEMVFAQPFEKGIIYKLSIAESVLNCAGMAVSASTAISFGIPEAPLMNDLVINEILFNPLTNGVDFVEIYNRSSKIIDLEQVWLGDVRHTPPNPPDTTLKIISPLTVLILPEQYLVLTTSPEKVKQQYNTLNPDNFLAVPSFPSYPNTSATALLKSSAGVLIDVMSYNEKMHYPLLNSFKGVSLERIDYDRKSEDLTNWHSASESVGFATPGYQNSMFAKGADGFVGEITVHPEIFSPDGDGRDDNCTISYQFDKPGYTLNSYIFDASGQQIRHLIKSTLADQKGSFSWDGLNEHGARVTVGIYIIHLEVFDLSGNTKNFRKAVVVATR
jgi:hypothetical protein